MADLDRNPVEVLAAEFTARYRGGQCPSISEYVRQYPDLADEIGQLFPSIVMIEQLSQKEHSQRDVARQVAALTTRPINRIGDFQIVRKIGRGGMGIVYEAVQESLGRRVALKVLTAGTASSPTRLRRFQREAQAAANLQHSNIVPIYGVGHEGALHYYVMQYIDGHGLDEVLTRLRAGSPSSRPSTAQPRGQRPTEPVRADGSYFRSVAQIGVQIAKALDYAHTQGVLHRDIKPANLILDFEGTAWITDFGLAKIFDENRLTQTGDLLGTLGYMAPEQLEGRAAETSDIYSLGLTLYELVTRRPAFPGDERVRLIRSGSREGPQRPRHVLPSIPRDLETIILTAISYDPSCRYATGREMANDLKRFIENRALGSHPVSVPKRPRHWKGQSLPAAGRRRMSFVLLVVTLFASVGLVGVNQRAEKKSVPAAEETGRTTVSQAAPTSRLPRFRDRGMAEDTRWLYGSREELAVLRRRAERRWGPPRAGGRWRVARPWAILHRQEIDEK